jgi:hypothetical protein
MLAVIVLNCLPYRRSVTADRRMRRLGDVCIVAEDPAESKVDWPIEQIPPKLKTSAIRICSNILIWRESLSAK